MRTITSPDWTPLSSARLPGVTCATTTPFTDGIETELFRSSGVSGANAMPTGAPLGALLVAGRLARGLPTDRNVDRALMAIAPDRQFRGASLRGVRDVEREVTRALDRLAVEGGDDVALLQLGLCAGESA